MKPALIPRALPFVMATMTALGFSSIGGAEGGRVGTPKGDEGTRIFNATEHPNYSGLFRLKGDKGTLVGSTQDRPPWDHLDYAGRHLTPVPGSITIEVDEKANTGQVVAEFVEGAGRYRVVFDRFIGTGYQDGGIATRVYEHGDAGNGDPLYPKTWLYLGGWGKANVFKNSQLLYKDYAAHFMVMERSRDPKTHEIRYPMQRTLPGGETDPAGMEIDLWVRSAESNPKNFPPFETFIHLYWEEVTWLPAVIAEGSTSHLTWTFDADRSGALPKGFTVGTLVDGRPAGEWTVIDVKVLPRVLQNLNASPSKLDQLDYARIIKVIETNEAPSPPRVLAQLMMEGFQHAYKVVLIEDITATDLDLEVSFLPIAGKGDMGGGLIWRAQDDRNYYLTRANPLEQNIRLYRVVNGVRHTLFNFDHIISVKTWHRLRVVAHGDRVQVIYDGQPVIELRDPTFTAGRVGLWTKSDAVTYFDDLQLRILK